MLPFIAGDLLRPKYSIPPEWKVRLYTKADFEVPVNTLGTSLMEAKRCLIKTMRAMNQLKSALIR